MSNSYIMQINNVTKEYIHQEKDVTALNDVSLNIKSGEFNIIQGASGSGKTTLLLLVGGLLAPSSGEVIIQQQNIYDLSPEKRARFRGQHIGFVFQQFYLIPYFTVKENVIMPNLALKINDIETRAEELLTSFQLDHRLNHAPAELSTGERQRVAMARALISEPQLLLADEPTGNLDEKNENIILEHMRNFADNGGAVLMVTHNSKIDICDQLIHLNEGKIKIEQ